MSRHGTPAPRATLSPRITLLSGGVGGARLASGLKHALPAGALTVVVNTGDDLTWWGLRVCPDLDTVTYTLAGRNDDRRGWGLRDETFRALEGLRQLGAESWFSLGDQDLAPHLFRTSGLARGERLTEVTARIADRLGAGARILPMCDTPCATWIDTASQGSMPFQEWLVRHRAEPRVRAVRSQNQAPATPEVIDALATADAVLVAPSNPYVSLDPILSRPGVRDALRGRSVTAVSPLIGGRAVKGPLASMVPELQGLPPSNAALMHHLRDVVTQWVVHTGDDDTLPGVPVLRTHTWMRDAEERLCLARETLTFAGVAPP